MPPGSIHAIGKGVLLLEVQQSCGVTYRVWDWNRMDLNGEPRELHIQKAMDVINFDPSQNTKKYFQYDTPTSIPILDFDNLYNSMQSIQPKITVK